MDGCREGIGVAQSRYLLDQLGWVGQNPNSFFLIIIIILLLLHLL
jgi:hypothetical protein